VTDPAAPHSDTVRADSRPPRRVWLSGLKLNSFRNYRSLSLALDRRSVVLTGQNGAGKTNLLEAVSFLSPGRGLRRAALDQVARRPGDGSWAVAATIENAAGSVDVGTGVALGPDGPEPRRSVRVDRVPARSAEALLDHLRVFWLTPAMDGLFTGPASDRRRFLDRAVLAIDRQHGSRVSGFERAMRGRNRLLAEPSPDRAWLDAIEAEMAELGVAIAAARREWVSLAAAMIATLDPASPFPAAEIALEGTLEHLLDGRSAAAAEEVYRMDLASERPRDAAAGRTLAGPHLSDLRVRHAAKQAAAEICSTGEQKALLVGLVLAEVRLAARLTGETPVVLLDEIAAHLDAVRRQALYDVLADLDCQAFMTGTDVAAFLPLGDRARFFDVSDGVVTPRD
jgi:DNA replication and repair protein RecF